jgi:membrane protein DedA with SNARE-associated domain
MILHFFISETFPIVFQWVIHHGYPLIFILLTLFGSIVIQAMSFAVTFGYFNLWIIFFLAFLGEILKDFILYSIGYFSRKAFINKFGNFLGASPEKMHELKTFIEKHPGKTLTAIKTLPLLSMPGLIMVGSSHMSLKRFTITICYIIVPKIIFFMILGYFFGNAYNTISKYTNNSLYGIGIVTIVAWCIFYIYKKLTLRFFTIKQ